MDQIPVFVISLKRSTDRRKRISALLKKAGVKFKFIDAVDGKELPADEIESIQSRCGAMLGRRGFPMTPSEIGCAMSHWNAYKKMTREDIDLACILEDDIEMTARFLPCLNRKAVERIHPGWGVFMLGHWRFPEKPEKGVSAKWRNRRRIDDNLKSAEPLQPNDGAYGYILNKAAAEAFLRIPDPFTRPVDRITGAAELYGAKRYLAVPPVVLPGSSFESSIKDREVMQMQAHLKKNIRSKARVRTVIKEALPLPYKILILIKNTVFLRLGFMGLKERELKNFKIV